MERHFETELQKLNSRINKMGNLVAEQVHLAMTALTECNLELAREIIKQDKVVDVLDVKIDKLCQRIFALNQPVATDLRLIMASLKMNNDLERMGDHAVGIAKRIENIAEFKEFISEFEIDEVATITDTLVKDVVNILTSRKTVFVKSIFEEAGIIKEKAQGISAKIVEEMTRKSDVIVVATNLIMVLTQIERIAGYSTNIAESVVFLVEGKMVKHAKLQFDQEDLDQKV